VFAHPPPIASRRASTPEWVEHCSAVSHSVSGLASVSAATKPVGSGVCPDPGRAAGVWVSSRILQRRKLDSLRPPRTQNGSIPRPLAANCAKTVSHSWRLRRRHLSLVAVALVTADSSLMNVGGIVVRGRGREKNTAHPPGGQQLIDPVEAFAPVHAGRPFGEIQRACRSGRTG